MDTLDTLQIILVIICSALLANYIYLRWSSRVNRELVLDGIEGFANPEGPEGDVIVLGNDHLFDEFYAKIYDKIIDGGVREETEVALTLGWAKGFRPEAATIQVLDVGCGTGGAVEHYRKAGVGKVVGLDISDAMVAAARKRNPKGDFRVGDIEQIGKFAAGEFNLVSLYYFTYYYLRDTSMMFKNAFQILQPGGCLVIHLVNRDKFDPILEAASPFVAFSVQKYSKERVTRSKVSFDKFDYEADFTHEGGSAEFREEFRFKNGKMRRQVHTMRMPTMDEVVATAEANGFVYKQFIDMTAIGYEYQYLFCFVR
jgi:SAM-dependent methyltransferase